MRLDLWGWTCIHHMDCRSSLGLFFFFFGEQTAGSASDGGGGMASVAMQVIGRLGAVLGYYGQETVCGETWSLVVAVEYRLNMSDSVL